jgi:hypothetical protein
VTIPRSRMLLASALSLLAPLVLSAQSSTKVPISPTQLVKDVIYNELHPPAATTVHWKYQLEKEVDGKQELRTVVETNSGSLDRLLSVQGKALNAADKGTEDRRILKFSRNADEQRKAEQGRRKDAEQCNAIMKMIPDAFIFEYAGTSGSATTLKFKPNPSFRPPSREGKVLQQMAGEMLVDARQKRLVSINGHLINEVKFGGGLLGHLEKGGEFAVKRAEIAPGDWEMTGLDVNMQGKALLFKSISVQQKEVHSDFERVADDLSLADAANLLLRQTVVASKSIPAGAGQP